MKTGTGAKSLGEILRAMRLRFADNQFERIAAKVPVSHKTITENWESEKNQPKARDLFTYIRLLRRSADAMNRSAEFENARLDIIHALDPDWWRLLTSPAAIDQRTPGEQAQDLVDYNADVDPRRPRRIREVDNKVGEIRGSLVVHRQNTGATAGGGTLPEKVFDVSAVFPIDKNTITIQRRAGSRSPYLFSIDLREQPYAIYNEGGKKALRGAFATEGRRELLSEASAKIQQFFHDLPDGKSCSWLEAVDSKLIPLRWASGGILPVARLLKKDSEGQWQSEGDWVVLFFRDVPPVGLNVGNGASEGLVENRNLEELISREFAEELILLNGKPKPGKSVKQVVFYDGTGGRALARTEKFLEFVEAHQTLRQAHDNVAIGFDSTNEPRFLDPLSTPFAVRVMDAGESITRCRNVIISVNPEELGIEVIRPYTFDLHEDEWLMDGEVLPSSKSEHPFLVRRPIVLLNLEFLREQYKSPGGLGRMMEGGRFLGGKQLQEIPAEAYRVFADLDGRESRLQGLRAKLSPSGPAATVEQKRSWEREAAFIEEWLAEYGATFGEAQKRETPLTAGPATTLCPVTFKTIELAFRHRVFGLGD